MLVSLEFLKNVLNGFKKDIEQDINISRNIGKIEPSDTDIPIVNLNGSIPTNRNEVFCVLDYSSLTDSFRAYAKIKIQGRISTSFPKKNFAIELFSDEGTLIPFNKEFKNWGAHNEYVLKANWIDHLHARNIASANLWADIVRNRSDFDSLPDEYKNSPNMCAIDGFPIKVYANGEYQGIYTWNIPKKTWMFNMDKSNPNHVVLQGNANDLGDESKAINPCNFNTLWDGEDSDSSWTIEEGKASEALTNSFNRIPEALMQIANYGTGKENLENALDIQSAINYLIFQEVLFGIDGLGNNLMLITYDLKKWYLSAYDMDSTLDLNYDGTMLKNPNGMLLNGDGLNKFSFLFACLSLSEIYRDRFVSTYKELRKSVLSYSNIISKFEKIVSVIDDDVRIEDTVPYPEIPSVTENTFVNLKKYLKARLEMLDRYFDGMEV